MRILLLTNQMDTPISRLGGAFNIPRLKALKNIGYDVTVIALVGVTLPLRFLLPYPKLKLIVDFYRQVFDIPDYIVLDGITVYYAKWFWLPRTLFWYHEVNLLHLSAGRKIISIIKRIKPDVVFTSWLHPFATYSKYLKKHFDFPIIGIIEGSDILVYPKKYRGMKRIALDINRYVDRLICVSNGLKEEAEKYLSPSKIAVIPNGFNEEIFTFSKELVQRKIHNKFNIISVGSLSQVKGHDLLLMVAKELDERFHFKIIGGGELMERYANYLNDNDLNERVELVGEIDQRKVKNYLDQSSIYCQPSRSESFGIAVLEALAVGLPAVVSNVGGLPELISPGVNGFLFQCGSYKDLKEKLLLAVETNWDHSLIADNVKKNYSWKMWAKRIDGIIKQTIEELANKYQFSSTGRRENF